MIFQNVEKISAGLMVESPTLAVRYGQERTAGCTFLDLLVQRAHCWGSHSLSARYVTEEVA